MSAQILVPILETPRLILRGHCLDDFSASAAMWADPAVVKYISGGSFNLQESWSRLLRYPGHWSMLGYGYWVVETKLEGEFVGEVGFADYKRDINPSIDGYPEAGWVFKSSAHGKGYATEAVRRMLEWGDEFLDCSQTVCIFDPNHAVSIKVARKVGYDNDQTALHKEMPALILYRASGSG